MVKLLINPNQLYDCSTFGMSQAVVDSSSGLVFVSGQVDWNHDYQVTHETVSGQLKNALKNLSITLDAAGANIETLLHVRVLIRGELEEHMDAVATILAEILGNSRPALTVTGVASLATKATLVEVEAVAKTRL